MSYLQKSKNVWMLFFAATIFFSACQSGTSPTSITVQPSRTLIAAFVTTPSPSNTSKPPTRLSTQPRAPSQTAIRTAARKSGIQITRRPAGGFTPTPSLCLSQPGTLQHHQFSSPYLSKPWKVSVYLPPCYNPAHPTGYPVLVLLHGQNLTDEQWWRDLNVTGTLHGLIQSGRSVPFLVVMPYEENSLLDAQNSQYDKAVGETLVDWTRKSFAACPLRECWAIGGISRGAAWAIGIGAHYYSKFHLIGAHSLALFHSYAAPAVIWLRAIPENERPILYLDSGQHDRYLSSTRDFEEALFRINYPHEWIINEGEHDQSYWQAHIEDYLLWYSESWKYMGLESAD